MMKFHTEPLGHLKCLYEKRNRSITTNEYISKNNIPNKYGNVIICHKVKQKHISLSVAFEPEVLTLIDQQLKTVSFTSLT